MKNIDRISILNVSLCLGEIWARKCLHFLPPPLASPDVATTQLEQRRGMRDGGQARNGFVSWEIAQLPLRMMRLME